jgi:hypothetical protein
MTKAEREALRVARWFQAVRENWEEASRRFLPQEGLTMTLQCKCPHAAVCLSHLGIPCTIPRRHRNRSGLCHLCENTATSIKNVKGDHHDTGH